MSIVTQNGKASAETKGTNGVQTVKPADKVTTPVTITQSITLLSQREKVEKLNLLFEREEKLSATRREIDRFKLATDESTNMLSLEDGKGAKFRTGNPSLIKSVIDLVVKELAAKQELIANDIIAIG